MKYRECPICKMPYSFPPAISRKDNKTEICPRCGQREALVEFFVKRAKEKKGKE